MQIYITKTHGFSIRPRAPEAEVNDLLYEGREVGPVKGAIVERQFALDGIGYLLFVTYDSPYEDSLRAILLDEACEPIGQVRVGPDGVPGFLGEVAWHDGIARFNFPADQSWRLRITTRRRWPGGRDGRPRLVLERVR